MKPWIKWTVGGLATIAVLVAVTAVAGLQLGEQKKARKIDIAVAPVAYVSDTQASRVENQGPADAASA